MSKLTKIFYGHIVGHASDALNAELCVEEAKKLAIDFERWVNTHYNVNEDGLSFCKYNLRVRQDGLTKEQLLNEFIENKYITNGKRD